MFNLIEELRKAADWINDQSEPAPDWEGLLRAAADEIESLRTEVETLGGMFDNVMGTMNVDYEDMFPEDGTDMI